MLVIQCPRKEGVLNPPLNGRIACQMHVVTSYCLGNTLYRLGDNGLANVLGLETLRHGTNLINFLSIRLFGGDPAHGGKKTGSTNGHNDDKDIKNYFFLFKDSEWKAHITKDDSLFEKIIIVLIGQPTIMARWHTFLSGYNWSYQIFSGSPKTNRENYARILFSGLAGAATWLVTPTLRFRFNQIDQDKLAHDPHYHGAAYRTSQKVEAWRIGTLGTLITGMNTEWFRRAKNKPTKIATGIVQLAAAAAIFYFALRGIQSPRTLVPLLIGAVLA